MSEEFKELLIDQGLPVEESEIKQQFETLTEEAGLITNTSKMSPFWRLVTAIAVAPVKWLTDVLIEGILPNLFVKTARGKWLDLLCSAVGIERLLATKAEGYITFTKENADISIRVPAGTIVQTERINDITYKLITQFDDDIPAGKTSKNIKVIAEQTGADFNLADGYYKILPVAINGIKSVENQTDWLLSPGTDNESDEELRERYRVVFSSVGDHHIDSVYRALVAKIAKLPVDRIYFLHDAPRGAGTANIYLLLDTGVAAQAYIDRINQYLMNDGYHGHGDDIRAFQMPEVDCDISLSVYFSNEELDAVQKQELLFNIAQMIRCAFRENNNYTVTKTYPYSRFSWSKLGEEIHEQYPQVKSLNWGQDDVITDLSIPRIKQLQVREDD
ncbi:Uncharacterized homolog of phage Mu protein gp47 [Actinobacillus lignieresii]|uniref:baseplate J/gp47 family protein n=1 Tax=Actinobacillus lignieresii TaxID=720 RepID=UPI000E13641F|nr:baseplate J/gp47 family protein [Actinobacillus lignieresii]SUT96047.1 Uncharacterized homolog of phage Mu protein gp47 [Actinobacillus lignieresii]